MPSASDPVRPHLPPVLILSVGVWVGAAVAYGACASGGRGCLWAMGGCGAAGFAVSLVYARKPKAVICLALGVCLGGMLGAGGAFGYDRRAESLDGVTGQLEFRAVGDVRHSGWSSSVECRLIRVDGVAVFAGPKVSLDVGDAEVWYGQSVTVAGTLSRPADASGYYRKQGIAAVCRAHGDADASFDGLLAPIFRLRMATVVAMEELSPGEESAVLAALVCGYRTSLSGSEVYEEFKLAGLGHLVAVSGAHLTVMFALISLGLKALKLRRRVRVLLQVGALLAFLVFCGIPLSALRAAVMVGLGLASYFSERRASVLNALGFVIIAVITLRPADALSASFLLSASSTLGIVLFCGLASIWVEAAIPFAPKGLIDGIALTLSATCLSLPFGISLFSQCSLVTVPANLVSAPLFTLACSIGMGAAAVHADFPGAGSLLLQVALALTEVLCGAVRWFAALPYSCVPATLSPVAATVMVTGMGALLWLFWPKPSAKGFGILFGATASICLVCVLLLHGTTRIVMLDVGQGDAILVQSGGRSMLIDTGNKDDLLRRALARSHIVHLDGVLITHPDDDHCGSLDMLSGVCEIDAVLVAQDLMEGSCPNCIRLRDACADAGLPMRGLTLGDAVSFGEFTLFVIWPHGYVSCGENEDSLCLMLAFDGNRDGKSDWLMLFTGDAGAAELHRMLADGSLCDVDALKVSHHGSATGLDGEILEVLRPEYALISVGEQNRYGHPSEAVLALLGGAEAEVYRTDRDGDISVIFTARGVRVCTQR